MSIQSLSLIRVFAEKDLKLISEMAYALFPIDYGAYVPQKHIKDFLDEFQSYEALKKQIASGYAYFLIYHKEDLAGYLGIHLENQQIELSKIYLNLNKRNQGLGKLVIEWLDDYAKKHEAKAVNLLVLKNNKAAIRFYIKNGFETYGLYEKKFDTGNSEVNVKMKKEYQSK